jgi:4-amino-4-deoxy-L-arabinose transferase-like glycosyltransferase
MSSNTRRFEPLVVFSIVAVIRVLGLFVLPQMRIPPDASEYRYLAGKIIETGRYGFFADWQDNSEVRQSTSRYLYDHTGSFRPPGFPLVLAGIRLVFGESEVAIDISMALIEAASAVLVFLIAQLALGPPAARIAFFLYLLNPGSVQSISWGCRESLITFLLLLGIYLAIQSSKGNAWLAILAGMDLGLATSVKENVIFVAMIAAVWLAALGLRRGKDLLWRAALIVVCAIASCAPWVIRNCLAYERLAGMSTAGGLALWGGLVGHDPDSTTNYTEGFLPTNRDRLDPLAAADSLDADRRLTQIVKIAIARDPAAVPQRMVRNMGLFWSPVSKTFLEAGIKERPQELISGVYYVTCFILAVAGFWTFRRNPFTLLVLFILAGMTLQHSITSASPRLRVPYDPLVLIFAAGFVGATLRSRMESRRS